MGGSKCEIETSLWPLEAAKWRGELRPPKVEYFARPGLHSRSIFASTKSPSLAADTNLSPDAEHPNEFPISLSICEIKSWERSLWAKKETKSKQREQNLNAMGCECLMLWRKIGDFAFELGGETVMVTWQPFSLSVYLISVWDREG